MNKQEELIILLGEQLLKYKKKYRKILSEHNELIYCNEILLKKQNEKNQQKKEYNNNNFDFGDDATTIFMNKSEENIHPKIKQEIEDNKKIFISLVEMSDNAVLNALDDKKFENQLTISEHIFDKNNYIKQGRDNDLRNDATDFINKHFFASDDKFYNFLINFYNVMSDALNKYLTHIRPYLKSEYGLIDTYDINKNIKLIFKGGNILKAVYLKYKYETSGTVADKLNDLFNKYFTRSDLDYQIIIYPNFTGDNVQNKIIYNYIVDKLSILVYWVMDEFRKGYIYKLDDNFDFYQLNNTCKISKLKLLKQKLNSTLKNIQNPENFSKFIDTYGIAYNYYKNMEIKNIFFNDICSDKNELDQYIKNIRTNVVESDTVKNLLNIQNYFYNYRNDIYVEDAISEDAKKISVKTINSGVSELKCEHYITFIKNIYSEDKKTKFIRTFALIRTKINFLAEFTSGTPEAKKYGAINIPGELIDLSISRFDDNRIKKFTSKTMDDMYTEYNFDGLDTDNFKFNSYNLEYLMMDLFEVIYTDNVLPWEDIKYEKRLYRLFFFSIIELLSLKNDEKDLNVFMDKLITISNVNIDDIINDKDYFQNEFSTINNQNIKKLMFLKIFYQHKDIVIKKNAVDDEKIKYYYKTIQTLLKEIKPILVSLNIFCNEQYLGKININDENFKKIHQMGGNNVRQKYIKYKKKYLLTKIE